MTPEEIEELYLPCPPGCAYCTDPFFGHEQPHPGRKKRPEACAHDGRLYFRVGAAENGWESPLRALVCHECGTVVHDTRTDGEVARCAVCDGKGEIADYNAGGHSGVVYYRCKACRGAGWVPKPFGEEAPVPAPSPTGYEAEFCHHLAKALHHLGHAAFLHRCHGGEIGPRDGLELDAVQRALAQECRKADVDACEMCGKYAVHSDEEGIPYCPECWQEALQFAESEEA